MMRPRLLDLFCGAGGAAMGWVRAPMPMRMEVSWAAGFFDGEGYVGVRRDKRAGRNPTLQIGIEQVRLEPLVRFAKAVQWDGNILLRPTKRAPERQKIHRLIMGHEDTVQTMMFLWPYLCEPKQEQFLKAAKEVDDATSKVA